MKLVLVVMLTIFVQLNAGEIQRIDSMLKSISNLRDTNVKLEGELSVCNIQLKDEQEKNIILKSELDLYSNYPPKEEDYKQRIKKLKNQLKEANNLLKTKEKCSEKIIIKTIVKKEKVKTKENNLINQIIEEENPFPKLKLKSKYVKASAYRVNKEAAIYDGINGTEIEKWEVKTSFTSNQETDKWIKVTGYFVDKIWRKSLRDIWVKQEDATRRDK